MSDYPNRTRQRTANRGGETNNGRRMWSTKWPMLVLSAFIGAGTVLTVQTGLIGARASTLSADVHIAPLHSEAAPVVQNIRLGGGNGVTDAVKKVELNVVGVENYSRVADFFSQASKLQAIGVGTGVMFFKDKTSAYLVTNNHVVQGAAKVDIVIHSGKHVDAEVIGTDPYTDLAVLKVPATTFRGIKPVKFADSNRIEPGETAIAIGTPLGLDFADTVTKGIVSAKSRVMPVQDEQSHQTLDYQTVIQTDAAINPGNSGGPLINSNGEVIGINSSKIVAPNFEGMGFAIPSNEASNVAKQLMQTGYAQHPALGIRAYSLASLPQQMWPDVPVDYGVWVKDVTSAQVRKDGLQPGDVIAAVNNHTVKTVADLRTYLFQAKVGSKINLKVFRGRDMRNLQVTIGHMNTHLTTTQQSNEDASSDGQYVPRFGTGWMR